MEMITMKMKSTCNLVRDGIVWPMRLKGTYDDTL